MAKYWLMKSEPDDYSIDDLKKDGKASWTGVRNYQARNFMRDEMKVGDKVLFYHSNTNPPGVVGTAEVAKESHPDYTARDRRSKYYDSKASDQDPRWFMVDVKFVDRFDRKVTLSEIKETPELEEMVLVKRSRLSVQPVKAAEFKKIVQMARKAKGK